MVDFKLYLSNTILLYEVYYSLMLYDVCSSYFSFDYSYKSWYIIILLSVCMFYPKLNY